jgi:hypothetical protein
VVGGSGDAGHEQKTGESEGRERMGRTDLGELEKDDEGSARSVSLEMRHGVSRGMRDVEMKNEDGRDEDASASDLLNATAVNHIRQSRHQTHNVR